MRKIFNTLVASILLVVCLFMVGCAKIPKDYKDARSNLLREDYYVMDERDFEAFLEGVDFLGFALLYEEDYENLEDRYYWLPEELVDEYKYGFEKGLVGTDEGEIVILAYFEDSKTARKFYKDVKELLQEVSESSYVEGFMNGRSKIDIKFGRSGKVVYLGTENALDAVRG